MTRQRNWAMALYFAAGFAAFNYFYYRMVAHPDDRIHIGTLRSWSPQVAGGLAVSAVLALLDPIGRLLGPAEKNAPIPESQVHRIMVWLGASMVLGGIAGLWGLRRYGAQGDLYDTAVPVLFLAALLGWIPLLIGIISIRKADRRRGPVA